MHITLRKYFFCFIAVLLFTACAQKSSFEWIKVNPDKINVAKTTEPYQTTVKKVSLIIDLKEKENTEFYNNSSGFFSSVKSENEVNTPPKYKSPIKNNIAKLNVKEKIAASVSAQKKPYNYVVAPANAKVILDSPTDKINGALKLPLKPINENKQPAAQKAKSFNKTAAEIRTMAFNNIKVENPEIEERSLVKAQKSKNLMWGGVILFLVGLISGFVFNRSAFFVAIAGVVFTVIGYFIRF